MPDKLLQYLRCFNDDKSGVTTIAISPDGQTLVSGSWDKTIKIWHLATGQLMRTLEGHKSPLTCVTLSPNGQTLVSSCQMTSYRSRLDS
jgi:WD40 repeat protein